MTTTTFFIIFIPILSVILLLVNLLLAPHNPYQEKDSVFECGFHSFLGQNRTQFSVSFFIFGLLFLLFDLEILLVYPYSVSGYTNDIYGLIIMIVFFILLTLGFIFELGKNALTIDSKQISLTRDNNVPTLDVFNRLLKSSFLDYYTFSIVSAFSFLLKYISKNVLFLIRGVILDKLTIFLVSVFTLLLHRFPYLYTIIGYIITYIYMLDTWVNVVCSIVIVKFKNNYPIYYYTILYICSEINTLLKGKITINSYIFFTFYVLYACNSYNVIMLILLGFISLVKNYLDNSSWIEKKHYLLYSILQVVIGMIILFIVYHFLHDMSIEIIIPVLHKIWDFVLKMFGFNNSRDNDPLGGNKPGNTGGDPDSPTTGFTESKVKKNKKGKSKTNVTEESSQEKFENEWKKEVHKLHKKFEEYADIENKHDNAKEIHMTWSDFNNKYKRWLSKKDKIEINEILSGLKDTKEANNENYYAESVENYWKNLKSDNKLIHKKFNMLVTLFEKNSNKIQQNNLGGIKSDNSKIFRSELSEVKDVLSKYYRVKDTFLTSQIQNSYKIDRLLKQTNSTVGDLIDQGVINK